MSHDELVQFNNGTTEEADLDSYCFRSAYVFQLLHRGYGFQMNDTIRATKVIDGHKVGWPLGSMLYEINTMPWRYATDADLRVETGGFDFRNRSNASLCLLLIAIGTIGTVMSVLGFRRRSLTRMYDYEPIKEVQV
jgi:hypothetical protein